MRSVAVLLLSALPAVATPPESLALRGAAAGTDDDAGDEVADDDDDWRYACDGTDAALLAEIDEAFRSRVGYGETWDESICNQGNLVQGGTRALVRRRPAATPPPAAMAAAPGAASVIAEAPATPDTPAALGATAAMTTGTTAPATAAGALPSSGTVTKEPTAFERRMNDQFFAWAIPLMAAVAGLFALVVAALIGLFLQLRRQIVLEVACPSCRTRIPFVVGESPQLFCPACGAPCRVDVLGSGDALSAHAVPL
ncbi:MAG: hypothetical protein FJ137_13580 [Deltaproteobacteria bacterium]|nr:hypothetical protein [Deltaproteobacteria bacterium]